MSASSSIETAAGSITVVTHVIQVPQDAVLQNPPEKKQLSQARLAAFGTVQIMIGLIVFLFGMVIFHREPTIYSQTGVFFWGALCFITAGSLTVAASKSLNRCLVNGNLGFSIATVVTSAAATTFYILDAIDSWRYIDWLLVSIVGVFSFLGVIISICVTVFSYKASRHFTDQQPILVKLCHETASQMPEIPPPYETPVTLALPTPPPPPPAPPPPTTPPPLPSESNYEMMEPLDYNTVISNF